MKRYVHFCILAALVFSLYASILQNPFVWDDHIFILQNEFVRDLKNIPILFKSEFFSKSSQESSFKEGGYYRPFVMVFYTLEYHLWRGKPFGFHLISILLHILNVFCVYLLIQRLLQDEKISFLGALLFASHPLHTEAVSYLPSRGDLFATFFCLISFLGFLSSKKKFKVLAPLSFLLALLSKETAIVFPMLLFVFERCHPIKRKHWLLQHTVYWALLLGYLALRFFFFPFRLHPALLMDPGLLLRILSFGKLILSYLSLLLFPYPLHLERTAPFQTALWDFGTLLFILVGGLLIGLGRLLWRKNRFLFFGLAWFLINLLPVSNVIPVYPTMAEHYLYLPSIGFFLILSFFLNLLFKRASSRGVQKFFLFSGFLILTCYASVIANRNRDYSDEMALFTQTAIHAPQSSLMYNNLGSVCLSRGFVKEAVELFEKSLKLMPNQPLVLANLGTLHRQLKNYDKAILFLKKALELNENAFFWNKLGITYAEMEKEDAVEAFQKAIKLNPSFGEAYFNLGVYYWNKNELEKTLRVWEEGRRKDPDYPHFKTWLPVLKEKMSKK